MNSTHDLNPVPNLRHKDVGKISASQSPAFLAAAI